MAFEFPLGAILPYAGPIASDVRSKLEQSGFFFCDGSELSRNQYKDLFDIIGNAYGDGDGRTTFNLPDFRGVFLRGCDNGKGMDPDRTGRKSSGENGFTGDQVGSFQEDSFAEHTHFVGYLHRRSFSGASASDKPIKDSSGSTYNTGKAGGKETRPVNIYVNYIIYAGQ